MSKRENPKRFIVAVAFSLAASTVALPAFADDDAATIEAGGRTFVRYCALCHGLSATGDGPLTESLQTPPPDLTKLAARNDGTFPEARVKEIIEKGGPKGHGMMAMLAWGKVFNEEVGSDSHKVIDELAAYLKSMQKP
ncbi:MAG: cytochrome c [Hyphomicrobiaceae bacterium]